MEAFQPIICAKCDVRFGMESSAYETLRKSSATFFCIFGHQQHFPLGPSEADKLRLERDRLKQEGARLAEDAARERRWRAIADEGRAAAERRASAARGRVTRLKNRAAAGVCPCCNRSFENLRRHMATKHASFTVEEVQAEAGTPIQ